MATDTEVQRDAAIFTCHPCKVGLLASPQGLRSPPAPQGPPHARLGSQWLHTILFHPPRPQEEYSACSGLALGPGKTTPSSTEVGSRIKPRRKSGLPGCDFCDQCGLSLVECCIHQTPAVDTPPHHCQIYLVKQTSCSK